MKGNDLIRTIQVRNRNGQVVGTKDVVTYPGLLSKAHDEGLVSVRTKLLQVPTDDNGRTAIAKVAIETAKGHFEAVGDASPDNVNSFIAPHLIRMAETRAKARALRDAVNIGVISFEELDGGQSTHEESDGGLGAQTVSNNGSYGSSAASSRAIPRGDGATAFMTEAQRRYLLDILKSRGIQQEDAEGFVRKRVGVESLDEVAKADATRLIDELLTEARDADAQRTTGGAK